MDKMIIKESGGRFYYNDVFYDSAEQLRQKTGITVDEQTAKTNTLSYGILKSHTAKKAITDVSRLELKFDCLASHDITYVGIIQTARASGLVKFPMPYVLTNCHNSLCAVGGTINEDDHMFGLSAAKKYGGIYVPPHLSVIHQYMREAFAAPGKMILGSDSHTRYGALGTLAIGEGGPELVKQLLSKPYIISMPKTIACHLHGKPRHGVGPHDIALALIGATFADGFVKNSIIEFVGEGIGELSMDFRNGIDVMTTETTCLSSVWETDNKTREYLDNHGRIDEYAPLRICNPAYYDKYIDIDLSAVEPMIALPFHPSNVYTIRQLNENAADILNDVEENAKKVFGNNKINFHLTDKLLDGKLYIDQGVIAGCAGGSFENLSAAAAILKDRSIGNDEFSLSVYPASQPINFTLMTNGVIGSLINSGATIRTAFCGPCFGAGDVPANNALSIRHSTRNFPNREGSKPSDGQISSVALMDARSIAATAANKGVLTAADTVEYDDSVRDYNYNGDIYFHRVFNGFNKSDSATQLKFGPNIADWPSMPALTDCLLLKVAAKLDDAVTTTDELIPSGETSSYRSNPYKLSEYTLSRKAPEYVSIAKKVGQAEKKRLDGFSPSSALDEIDSVYKTIEKHGLDIDIMNTGVGSVIYANKPGDGSAREQAASCQKVLGTWANIAHEYATKRYRSNLINWGMLPFILEGEPSFNVNDYIYITGLSAALISRAESVTAYVVGNDLKKITLLLPDMTDDEREIIAAGCLINYYRTR